MNIDSLRQLEASNQIQNRQNPTHNTRKIEGQELVFERLLKEQYANQTPTQDLRFSKHASQRITQRNIDVSQTVLDGLKEAVEKARTKGAKDVVVIGQQGAFVVNIPNNTVVTTMSKEEMKDNIFTNIDSAVIM